MTDAKRYTIRDPRPTRAESPWSFYLPCEARQNAVTIGDFAQLIFEGPDDEDMSERMWVRVTEDRGEKLLGTLENAPFCLEMTYGEEVEFERFAIIDIDTERKDDPEETNVTDDRVFHRCWVDARVLDDGMAPARATNGHPQPEGYDGGQLAFPWGGWMIVGEGWTEDMPLEIGTPVLVMRREPAIAEHLMGDDVPTLVEKIDGEWRSRAG